MSSVSINGLPVIEARLQVPRFGAWFADVVVDALTSAQLPPGSAVTLNVGGLPFMGTNYRSDAYAQTVMLRVVGGKNGLAERCRPRFYNGCAIRLPLRDLASDAGEAVSSSSDAGALGTVLPMWAMVSQPVSLALSSLAQAGPVGTVWRILPDGSLFFGVDAFPASGLTDFQLVDYMPQEGLQVIAAETPSVYPGQTFNSRQVSVVEHVVNALTMRSKIWFEGAAA